MELELYIRGSLADLHGETFPDTSLLAELERRGLSAGDARLALDKAVIEGWVVREGEGRLRRTDASRPGTEPGNLAKT